MKKVFYFVLFLVSVGLIFVTLFFSKTPQKVETPPVATEATTTELSPSNQTVKELTTKTSKKITITDTHPSGASLSTVTLTTTGGKALKFYTSVRIDIRRIAQIKKGEEVMGGRHRVKVVKNKVAAPFRQTEFDLMYNEGISKEGEMLALGEKYGFVKKGGTGTYELITEAGSEKIGRGYDAAHTWLREHTKESNQLLKNIRGKLSEE
jgi:protein RecA